MPQLNKTDKTLTLLTGWGVGAAPLQPIFGELQAAHPAVAMALLDLPGYGDTPLISDFYAAADALAEELQQQESNTRIVGGWSLGAMLALACAARHPGLISHLVLIAGTPSFVQREGWEYAMPAAQLAEFTTAVLADFAAMLPRFVGGFNRGDVAAKAVTKQILEAASQGASPAPATLATGLGWLAEVDLRPLLAKVTTPTMIIHGAHDPLMPLAGAEAMAAALPQAQLHVFADCAHAPFISGATHFSTLLSSLLTA